jgi:hypothetical protein
MSEPDPATARRKRWRELPEPVTPEQYVETVDVAQRDDRELSAADEATRAGG